MVLVVLRGRLPRRAAVLLPMALTLGPPTLTCPHPRGETSTTIGGVGSRHISPSLITLRKADE
nr:MAG TPA: hypothetical protein [Caudoviricetes sp.]